MSYSVYNIYINIVSYLNIYIYIFYHKVVTKYKIDVLTLFI